MLNGTITLVTGGGSGIGLATALKLLRNEVAKVYIGDISVENGESAENTLSAKYGKRVKFLKLDVTNFEEFKNVFEIIIKENGRLDILINNAGIIAGEKVLDINIGGVLNGIKLGMEFMKESSRIINTASTAGIYPCDVLPEYTASKHAVIGLTKTFATDHWFKKTGISIMAICPGVTTTGMLKNIPDTKEIVDYFQPYKRQKPEIVADGVITMLRTGKNGSFWVVSDGEPAYEVEILTYKRKESI